MGRRISEITSADAEGGRGLSLNLLCFQEGPKMGQHFLGVGTCWTQQLFWGCFKRQLGTHSWQEARSTSLTPEENESFFLHHSMQNAFVNGFYN